MGFNFVIISILFLFIKPLLSQVVLNEGIIEYTVTNSESNLNNHLDYSENLVGSNFIIYFNKYNLRTDVNMMNGAMKYSLIEKFNEKTNMLYLNMQGHKIKVEIDANIHKGIPSDVIKKNIKYNIIDTQSILGYSCYSAEINPSIVDSMESYLIYITSDLKTPNFSIGKINIDGIKGVPLKLSKINSKSTITYTASKIIGEVDSRQFLFDDTGYILMDYKNMSQIIRKL